MKLCLFALLSLMVMTAAAPAFAGHCDHAWEYASDGSRCGGRSADSREGGN